jgi:hypothetical protein
MQLPISFASFPVKEKYIDEETSVLSRWMVFGEHKDGTVDVCDAQGNDIFTRVPAPLAELLCRKRNIWVGELLEQLNGKRAFPGWPPC